MRVGLFICCFLLSQLSLLAQASDQAYAQYEIGFPFTEGVYLSFVEFRDNAPEITYPMKKVGSVVYYQVSEDSVVQVDANAVWGYSLGGNVYIARNGLFWKCINIGQLTQFTAIESSTFRTIDNFGFYNEVQTQNIQRSFLDMQTGQILKMDLDNIKPYIEQEPTLNRYIKRSKKAKHGELVLVLKGYNQLNPLYFPVYE